MEGVAGVVVYLVFMAVSLTWALWVGLGWGWRRKP